MDNKAKKILFEKYWGTRGWKSSGEIPLDDFNYAKNKGLMFDSYSSNTSQTKEELIRLYSNISSDKIIEGFLASFSNKRLDWRSAIASYFNVKYVLSGSRRWSICSVDELKYENEDLNILNFERIKWGGVRYKDLLYNFLDLNLFEKEIIKKPSKNDIEIVYKILNCINNSSDDETPSKLVVRLKEVVSLSKVEIQRLIEILGCCEFIKPGNYNRRTSTRSDWDFAEYWRGEDKINRALINKFFKEYFFFE